MKNLGKKKKKVMQRERVPPCVGRVELLNGQSAKQHKPMVMRMMKEENKKFTLRKLMKRVVL